MEELVQLGNLPIQLYGNEEETSPLSQYSSIGEAHLCRRCEELTGVIQEDRDSGSPYILKSTLRANCKLCDQFFAIFQGVLASDVHPSKRIETQTKTDLFQDIRCQLTRRHVRLRRVDEVCNDVYLYMRFNGPEKCIRLFPKEITITSLSNGKDYERRLGYRLDPDSPDYELVKDWLNSCQKNHDCACLGSPIVNLRGLRLIDCESRTIVETYEHERYTCLSYLWGCEADSDVKVTKALPQNIPKVVEDAMHVTLKLGIRYLWVDRYCINQQNQDEKHGIIRQMDKIYNRAALTLIAAVGDSPHHGLPGVRGTPRRLPYRLQVGSQKFHEFPNVEVEILNSKWNTRGWTLQECLLSSRRLVFTSSQMYFQCQKSHALESFCPELL